MGCGTSKAAQVIEEEITIKDYPISSSPHHHPHTQTDEVPNDYRTLTDEINSQPSDQSAIEKGVRNLVSSQPITIEQDFHEQNDGQGPLSSTDSLQRPIAFEVCMSTDGTKSPMKAPPRRLKSLQRIESSSKVTSEHLAEKQKIVEERKQKELSKRANSRISRKERLRKEVIAAREMEILQNGDRLETENSKQPTQNGVENKIYKEDEDCFQGSYDASAEIEVDSTYNNDNEEQLGMWDDNDVEGEISKPDQSVEFFDEPPLTNSQDQYM